MASPEGSRPLRAVHRGRFVGQGPSGRRSQHVARPPSHRSVPSPRPPSPPCGEGKRSTSVRYRRIPRRRIPWDMRRTSWPELIAFAREMRRRPTPAECRAWAFLRRKQCFGLRFRRQVILSGFIVDFYCARPRIVIEIDGPVHRDPGNMDRDRERDRLFDSMEIRVVRLRNEEVSHAAIVSALNALPLPPPSPLSGEGVRGRGPPPPRTPSPTSPADRGRVPHPCRAPRAASS